MIKILHYIVSRLGYSRRLALKRLHTISDKREDIDVKKSNCFK